MRGASRSTATAQDLKGFLVSRQSRVRALSTKLSRHARFSALSCRELVPRSREILIRRVFAYYNDIDDISERSRERESERERERERQRARAREREREREREKQRDRDRD